jgi:hypothetical protein
MPSPSPACQVPAPVLTERAPGIWTAEDPVRIAGMPLHATMTVVEIGDGRLLLFSPVEMTPERRAAIDRLGEVAHLYAPNTYHHVWMGPWAQVYTRAVVHAPRALRSKREDLRIDREHDCDPIASFASDLAPTIDEVHVDGFRLEESVLVHRPSGTLLVADLVHNIGRSPELWTRIYAGTRGFYGRIAISGALRWLAFRDRVAARASIDRILESPFDRIVVGHGNPVDSGGRAALVAAYRWLRPGPKDRKREGDRALRA